MKYFSVLGIRAVPPDQTLHPSVSGFYIGAWLVVVVDDLMNIHMLCFVQRGSLTLCSHLLNHSRGPNRKALECSPVFENVYITDLCTPCKQDLQCLKVWKRKRWGKTSIN